MKLKIDYLNNLGNGVALHPHKVFVPYTLDGEEIDASLVLSKKDFTLAQLNAIITPSRDRISAPCTYFTRCGGCNLQHLSAKRYQQFKESQLKEVINKIGSANTESHLFILGGGMRHRASFKVINKQLGFYKQSSHEIVQIAHCIALNKELNATISLINKIILVLSQDIVQGVELVSTDNGIDCLFLITDQLSLHDKNIIIKLITNSNVLRLSYKIGACIETIYCSSTPVITIGNFAIELPLQCFLQASKESIKLMSDLIGNLAAPYKNIADLFAGIGTYGYFLCMQAAISCFESDKLMVQAMNHNAKKYNLNMRGFQRNLHTKPLKHSELKNFDLAIVNPPRSGAPEQIAHFCTTDIIMVSCSANSFIRDAIALMKKGYKMTKIYAIDQFHWTPHIELIAFFQQ
jgi:23S rRNA (uracil1939-C5)-methyltransferase